MWQSNEKPNTSLYGIIVGTVCVVIILAAVVVSLSFVSNITSPSNSGGGLFAPPTPPPPNFSLSNGNVRTEAKLSGSTCWYDIGVRNYGGDGWQTINCQFTQGSTQVTRSQSVYLRANEYQVVTFTFPEYTSWSTSNVYCRAWL